MKLIILLFMSLFVDAQNRKIDFFKNTFFVNNNLDYRQGFINTITYKSNYLMWSDEAPPEYMRFAFLAGFNSKNISGPVFKELRTTKLNIKLIKKSWKGKLSQYQEENTDSITNFVQLYGNIKSIEKVIIIKYKTSELESFKIPVCFNFLEN